MGARRVNDGKPSFAQRREHVRLHPVAANNHDALLHVVGRCGNVHAVGVELFDNLGVVDQRSKRIGVFIVEHGSVCHIERTLDSVANASMFGANHFHGHILLAWRGITRPRHYFLSNNRRNATFRPCGMTRSESIGSPPRRACARQAGARALSPQVQRKNRALRGTGLSCPRPRGSHRREAHSTRAWRTTKQHRDGLP